MPRYRRYYLSLPVFVTIVTHQRRPWMVEEAAPLVLAAMRRVKERYPFRHLAHVILPDHLHWIFEPYGPGSFSDIVGAVKREMSWRMKERGAKLPLWQDRFFDHLIRDEADLERHLDYVHYNPVKHGLAPESARYPHSSFPEWRRRGAYAEDWGRTEPERIKDMKLE